MNSIAALILRYVGQNEEVTLDDLEWVEDKSYREVQTHMKWLIKNGYLLEKKEILRKFRALHLTEKGIQWCQLDLPTTGNKLCATIGKKTKSKLVKKNLISGSFH